MWIITLKWILSGLIIVAASEVAKRSGQWGGLIVSLPIISIISMTWLYIETKDTHAVIQLSHSILWFILPSLTLFIIFPLLLKKGIPFYGALLIACLIVIGLYATFFWGLQQLKTSA